MTSKSWAGREYLLCRPLDILLILSSTVMQPVSKSANQCGLHPKPQSRRRMCHHRSLLRPRLHPLLRSPVQYPQVLPLRPPPTVELQHLRLHVLNSPVQMVQLIAPMIPDWPWEGQLSLSAEIAYTQLVCSIPRPEVVKRVRPDKDSPSPRPEAGNTPKTDAMEVDRKPPSAPTSTLNGSSHTTSSASVVRKDLSLATSTSRPQTPTSALGKEPPQSPRNHRAQDEKQNRSDKPMAPPSVPSQTLSAQELRETAKQTMVNRPERPDDRPPRGSYQRDSTNEPPVPRRRSVSPPSRPGTRNASADSRASGGRARSDRGSGDDKKSDRDNRQEPREHGSSHGRRDSRTDRGTRDREKDKDVERDRDRDRPRDRHGDREKERSHRDRDRERDRDRDRDRDRHRRDDKDRDRENRKDRDTAGRNGLSNAVAPAADGRGLPTRPDPSRHREVPGYEESLGKRRRPVDDEVSALDSDLMLLTHAVH